MPETPLILLYKPVICNDSLMGVEFYSFSQLIYTVFELFIAVIKKDFFFFFPINLYHSPGNLKIEKKKMGFISSVW